MARHGRRDARVEEVSVGDFFAELEGSEDADRYKALRQALEARLSGLTVIRIGERKVDVYLIGRAQCRRRLGRAAHDLGGNLRPRVPLRPDCKHCVTARFDEGRVRGQTTTPRELPLLAL